jgi:hypothetical protein
MTSQPSPYERVRAANPVPVPVEPDWGWIRQLVERDSLSDSSRGYRRSPLSGPCADPKIGSGCQSHHLRLRILGGLALCLVLTVSALVAIAPWSNDPGFLARAAAALTLPGGGAVLYERWEHVIAPGRGNPVFKKRTTFGPEELWIEGRSPHRYRAVLEPGDGAQVSSRPGGAGLADTYGANFSYVGDFDFVGGENTLPNYLQRRLSGQPLEIGGTLEAPRGKARQRTDLPTLTFLASRELLSARIHVTLGATLPGPHDQIIENGSDPASALRTAISEGRAHEAGTGLLDGRTVQRIALNLPSTPPADAPPPPEDAPVTHTEAYAEVEPKTFHPVEIVFGRDIYRFLAYEYLPATAANLALANIRAQHPNATVSDQETRAGARGIAPPHTTARR